jgi:hypothetical protein
VSKKGSNKWLGVFFVLLAVPAAYVAGEPKEEVKVASAKKVQSQTPAIRVAISYRPDMIQGLELSPKPQPSALISVGPRVISITYDSEQQRFSIVTNDEPKHWSVLVVHDGGEEVVDTYLKDVKGYKEPHRGSSRFRINVLVKDGEKTVEAFKALASAEVVSSGLIVETAGH